VLADTLTQIDQVINLDVLDYMQKKSHKTDASNYIEPIYVNDIQYAVTNANIKLFADDINLFIL